MSVPNVSCPKKSKPRNIQQILVTSNVYELPRNCIRNLLQTSIEVDWLSNPSRYKVLTFWFFPLPPGKYSVIPLLYFSCFHASPLNFIFYPIKLSDYSLLLPLNNPPKSSHILGFRLIPF